MIKNADYWITKLNLSRHPEGGYYRETYRSKEIIHKYHLPDRFTGDRAFSTSIYFLVTDNDFSGFHRIASDEIWHFHTGNTLTLFSITPQGKLERVKLGLDLEQGEVLQTVIPAGYWFAAVVDITGGFALVGCTVAPGFDYHDFELGKRKILIEKFPQHKDLIIRLTRK